MTPRLMSGYPTPILNSGYKPSPVDHRDYLYRAVVPVASDGLPETFRCPQSVPFYDQGEIPKCVATSLAAIKSEQSEADLSVLKMFNDDELYSRIAQPGGGANIRDGLEQIRTNGYISLTDGQRYFIGSYAGVTPTDHEAVKHALVNQGILEGGFNVPHSFMEGGGKEFHLDPGFNPNGSADPIVGGHAIAIVAYTLIGPVLHNSWGVSWGQNGELEVSWDFFDTYFQEVWSLLDQVVPKPIIAPATPSVVAPSGDPTVVTT